MNRDSRGFTLVELMIALVLLALLSAVLYGSLGFAATTLDRGEAKVDATSGMRLAQAFLRANLEEQHPLRMRKILEWPLVFTGDREELRYAAVLPARVASGGVWFYRLSVRHDEARTPLVLERMLPDLAAPQLPEFTNAERSVLAQDGAADAVEPIWRDRWDDRQRLPIMIRIEVTPTRGPSWPPLFVAPREAPDAGCRAFDQARQRCAQL